MFELSSKTQVDKKFKLPELYKLIGANKDVKANAKNVLSIVLTNVLSKDTMNFADSGDVKEIYVFEVTLSEKTIPAIFITALDKEISLHTIFVLRCGDEKALYAALKQKAEKGIKTGKYYCTQWDNSAEPIRFPVGINSLDDIYSAMIENLIPINAKDEESPAELIARYEKITKLKSEISKMQKLVDNEKQSKKRFEYNDKLKQLKKEFSSYE